MCVQFQDGEWTVNLARECQTCVLRAMVVGLWQPPLRMGALRLLHRVGRHGALCAFEDCKPSTQGAADCPTNRISYVKDRNGYRAEMVLVHFKNDAIKGEQHIPLAEPMLEMVAMLERAAEFMSSKVPGGCRTLFFDNKGDVYTREYFSSVVTKALSFEGHRVTATDCRHLFATAWRDFVNSPYNQLHDLNVAQLTAAAADMMLNSTEAWNGTYDDTNRERGVYRTLAKWSMFRDFIERQYLDKASEEAWDPLSVDMELLQSKPERKPKRKPAAKPASCKN